MRFLWLSARLRQSMFAERIGMIALSSVRDFLCSIGIGWLSKRAALICGKFDPWLRHQNA
jgi:hypothetical protein